jgi:hypothetical protein
LVLRSVTKKVVGVFVRCVRASAAIDELVQNCVESFGYGTRAQETPGCQTPKTWSTTMVVCPLGLCL